MARANPNLGKIDSSVQHFKTDKPVGFDDNNWPIFGYNAAGCPVCYANKRNGRGRCMSPIRYPNGRCKLHGGPTPGSLDHHSFRSGLYAGKMNKQGAKILIESVNDPDYLSLREELGINTGMIARTLSSLKRIDADEHTWGEILVMGKQLEALAFDESLHNLAITTQSQPLMRLLNLAEKIARRAEAGYDSKKLNAELTALMESRRKLVETDLKRIQITKHNMPADHVMTLFENFAKTVVGIWGSDPQRLQVFAAKMDELLGTAVDGSEMLKALSEGNVQEAEYTEDLALDEDVYDVPGRTPIKHVVEEEEELDSFLDDNNCNEFLEKDLETGRIEVNIEKLSQAPDKKYAKKISF